MAAFIGRERELEHLRAFRYGSASFTHEVTRFWLNGDLTISPIEQVAFLRRLFSYELPVDRRHIDTVKTALIMPGGKLSNASGLHDFALQWPTDTIVRVKTGNGTVNGERVSWLVGALESSGRQYVFASRARSATRSLNTTAGADLVCESSTRSRWDVPLNSGPILSICLIRKSAQTCGEITSPTSEGVSDRCDQTLLVNGADQTSQ
jgi:hypothetical protein